MSRIFTALCVALMLFTPSAHPDGKPHNAPGDCRELTDRELNIIGYQSLVKKNYRDAEKYFLLAIRKNPSVKFYYNNLSAAYIHMRNFKSAYTYLQAALSLDPRYVKALINMSVTCFNLFKFREAYSYYLRAKSIDTRYTEIRFKPGRVIEAMERIRRDNPENQELDTILNYMKKRFKGRIQ